MFKGYREYQNTHFIFNNFLFENCAIYERMWKNNVQLSRPHMTIRYMCTACWIPKATNTHRICITYCFHCNNGCTNAPQCYIIHTLLALLCSVNFFLGLS